MTAINVLLFFQYVLSSAFLWLVSNQWLVTSGYIQELNFGSIQKQPRFCWPPVDRVHLNIVSLCEERDMQISIDIIDTSTNCGTESKPSIRLAKGGDLTD